MAAAVPPRPPPRLPYPPFSPPPVSHKTPALRAPASNGSPPGAPVKRSASRRVPHHLPRVAAPVVESAVAAAVASPAESPEVSPAASAPLAVRSQAAGEGVASHARPSPPVVAAATSSTPSSHRNSYMGTQFRLLFTWQNAVVLTNDTYGFRSTVEIACIIRREFRQARFVPHAADTAAAVVLLFSGPLPQ